MNRYVGRIGLIMFLAAAQWGMAAEPVVLKADKDNFSRSQDMRNNSGAARELAVAHNESYRAIVGFDLSSITNEIESVEFRITQLNTQEDALDLTIALMRHTPSNAQWTEGAGALGVQGRLSRVGESCYARSGFPDAYWESAPGSPLERGLGASALWLSPTARLSGLQWQQGEELSVSVKNVKMLETIRNSDDPIVTFGLWGTAGQGVYLFGAKESGKGPELILTLIEEESE